MIFSYNLNIEERYYELIINHCETMKYLFPLMILLLCNASLIAQKVEKNNDFTLSGKVIGKMDGSIYIEYLGSDGKFITDSCLLKKGSFQLKGHINRSPLIASLSGQVKSQNLEDPNFTCIFLEPGQMHATLEVNRFKLGRISGSQSQDEYAVYCQQREQLTQKWKSRLDSLLTEKNDSAITQTKAQVKSLMRSEEEALLHKFIKQYPDSYVSTYLLFADFNLKLDSLKVYYDILSPRMKQSIFGERIKKDIIKKEELLIRKSNVALGKLAPGFTQNDVNGKANSLQDFKGQYVLLEFWASWCVPCRAESPNLKKVYNLYKGYNFNIIGISLDEDKDAWLKAITKDGLTWTQLSDLKGAANEVAVKHGVQEIPANFLIDPDGKIIATNLRGEDLNRKLESILK